MTVSAAQKLIRAHTPHARKTRLTLVQSGKITPCNVRVKASMFEERTLRGCKQAGLPDLLFTVLEFNINCLYVLPSLVILIRKLPRSSTLMSKVKALCDGGKRKTYCFLIFYFYFMYFAFLFVLFWGTYAFQVSTLFF